MDKRVETLENDIKKMLVALSKERSKLVVNLSEEGILVETLESKDYGNYKMLIESFNQLFNTYKCNVDFVYVQEFLKQIIDMFEVEIKEIHDQMDIVLANHNINQYSCLTNIYTELIELNCFINSWIEKVK
jgi:hypothetical protein